MTDAPLVGVSHDNDTSVVARPLFPRAGGLSESCQVVPAIWDRGWQGER